MTLSRAHPGAALASLRAVRRPGRVARDGQNGMHDEANVDAAFGQLRQHRVDQERHVVVDDLEHRLRCAAAPGLRAAPPYRGGCSARPACARRAGTRRRRQVRRAGAGRSAEDLPGPREQKSRRRNPPESRDGRRAGFARRGDQRRFGTLFIGAGKVGGYHVVFPRRACAERTACLRFKSMPPQVFPMSHSSLSHRSCGVER